jgi:hypothetical protein
VAIAGNDTASSIPQRLGASPGVRQDQDLEFVALEVPSEHLILERGLEGLGLPREAAQGQRAHVDFHQAGLDVAPRVADLEVPVRRERAASNPPGVRARALGRCADDRRPEAAALEPLLEQLGLHQAAAMLPDWLDRAASQELSYADFLHGLLEEESVADRDLAQRPIDEGAKSPHDTAVRALGVLRPAVKP